MREVKKYARFYLQARKKWAGDKQKDKPVIMWFNYNNKCLNTTTGIHTCEQNWDSKKQRLKPGVTRATEVNRYLDLLEQKVNDIYFKALSEGTPINNAYIIERLKSQEPKTKQVSFFGEWEKYFEMQSIRIKPSTLISLRISYNRFKAFCKVKGLTNFTFEDYTPQLKSEYAQFLLKTGNNNNTIHTNHRRMARFLNYAMKVGLHSNDKHKEFQIKQRVGTIKFLEWGEVKQLMDVELQPGMASDARDLFVFCCLTGMRYSDVSNLKKADIKEHTIKGLEGVHYAAHIRQVKTDRPTVIPLLPEALAILEKYKDEKNEFALPHHALQSVNTAIKLVAKEAKLNAVQEKVNYKGSECKTTYSEKWKVLSTHVARRSFVTVAATRGIPINIVASITGQNPATTMKHYMGVIGPDKFREMMEKMKF